MAKVNRDLHAVFSDKHIPFHDRRCDALEIAFCQKYQPAVVHLLGDIVDFYGISRFHRDPARKLKLQQELDLLADYFSRLRMACPDSRIIYSEGNHEHRLQKFLMSKAEELYGLRALHLPELAGFPSQEIEWKPESAPYCMGGLWFSHGDMIRKHAAYTARAMAEKVGGNVIIGHTHRLGTSHTSTWNHHYTGWENGCLCKLKAEYVIGLPNWQHGFHAIQFHRNFFNVEPVRIERGRCSFRGDLLTGKEAA